MTVNNAVIIIWIVIILMVSSVSLSGVSSCSINLIATTAAFNLGTNVTLTCTVCTVESGIEFKHNGTNIASYGFDIQVVNATLHKASVKENGDGSAEMTLTIFNLAKSSNGVYSCSTSPSDSSSLTLAYTESKPTTDDGLSPGELAAIICGCIAGVLIGIGIGIIVYTKGNFGCTG
ncbi:uncharacterized protein LOC127836668 isoform X2 [Dreissena polymorpha]|uniref:uncharacterized protein LOC127836668 isoform X2 n=1 Tax=Dreissena polymorpha TaxID=45954 RepID=UPI002264ACF8|nr:uncharacterized protein LOC127836668 isoform X2 [Dreissena polymorpha]